MGVEMDVFGGTHGNEPSGPQVLELLTKYPINGVRPHNAHPNAVRLGQRYLGDSGQIMSHYPGDPTGDPEDRAAYANMEWLGNRAGNPDTLVVDLHNMNTEPTYFSVGTRTLQTAITSAYRMGYRVGMVSDGPFFRAVPNSVVVEDYIDDNSDLNKLANEMYENLAITAGSSNEELQSQYPDAVSKIDFYKSLDVLTLGPDGKIADYIPELEAIKVEKSFEPIELPNNTRKALGVPDDGQLYAQCWNHHNMSPDLPEAGQIEIDGQLRPRKVAFGCIALKLDSPVVDGPWVEFKV